MKHQHKVDPEGKLATRDEKETARKAGDKETARKNGDKEKHILAARDQSNNNMKRKRKNEILVFTPVYTFKLNRANDTSNVGGSKENNEVFVASCFVLPHGWHSHQAPE